MSAAEQQTQEPEVRTSEPQPTEVERARQEDPEFDLVLARARAKARGEEFDPEKHMAQPGRPVDEVKPEIQAELNAIIRRFAERGRGARHLRAVDWKEAQGNG